MTRDTVDGKIVLKQVEEQVGRHGSESSFSKRLKESILTHNYKLRQDKSSEQVDFEKNSALCTFTP